MEHTRAPDARAFVAGRVSPPDARELVRGARTSDQVEPAARASPALAEEMLAACDFKYSSKKTTRGRLHRYGLVLRGGGALVTAYSAAHGGDFGVDPCYVFGRGTGAARAALLAAADRHRLTPAQRVRLLAGPL
jgi:hypothetical protein